MHEAVAGQACRLESVVAGQLDDFLLSAGGIERVFVQAVLVDRPFDPGQAKRAGAGKFFAPFAPRERLDLAVDQGRQPSLHETDALYWHLRDLHMVIFIVREQ